MGRRPDLILINPGNRATVYGQVGDRHGIAPPLGIAMIAAVVRARGYAPLIIDAQADGLSPDEVARRVARERPLLAGVSACTPQMTAAGEILAAIRREAPGVRTIIGGHHASALPRLTLEQTDADLVCAGEGFHPVAEVLQILRDDPARTDFPVAGITYRDGPVVVQNPPAPLAQDLEGLPFAAWDLLPMDRYRAHNWHCFGHERRSPYAVVFTSLGCPFSCTYCSVNAVYGRRGYRTRSPEQVVAEIELLAGTYGVRHMEIVDDTFTIDNQRVHRICDLLIERGLGLNLWAYARTDTVDLPLLRKMKSAGISWVCYGFESGNDSVLQSVRKGQDAIGEAVDMTRAAGLHIMANYLFGLPEDSRQSLEQTLALAMEINAEYANFYCAMAYPGSQLYDDAVRNGLRLPEVWHGYSQYAYETLPLSTRHLAAAEVLRFRDQAFIRYFSNPRYLAMMEHTFGAGTVQAIEEMLSHRLRRKYA